MSQAENMSSQQSYISPSDTIMSPTTKKLAEMKGKRFTSGKPQSLFAKTVGKRAQAQAQAQTLKAQGQTQDEEEGRGQDPEADTGT